MPTPRTILLGPAESNYWPSLLTGIVLFVATLGVYGIGVFGPSAPVFPAVVPAVIAAIIVGYYGTGIGIAWFLVFSPSLGYHASDAVFGASNLSLAAQLGYIFAPRILVTLLVQSVVVGTIGFGVGYVLTRSFDSLRRNTERVET